MLVDILKEACQQVYEKTKGLAGTAVGSRRWEEVQVAIYRAKST